MANNKNGVLNKVLNFVGLVDDEPETRSANYNSGSYGRQEAYRPERQRNDRGAAARQTISEKGGRSNYGTNARRPRAEEPQPTAARPALRTRRRSLRPTPAPAPALRRPTSSPRALLPALPAAATCSCCPCTRCTTPEPSSPRW